MTKVHARTLAIELRKNGYSYNHIASALCVSKSTVGSWVGSIPYSPNAETVEKIGKARAAARKRLSEIRQQSFIKAREEAIHDIGEVSNRDFFMFGLGLYVGEGMKSDISVRFTNSNIDTVKSIIRWFTQAINMPVEHIRIRVHLYHDSDIELSHRYWSKQTGVPRSQFFKPVIDTRVNKKTSNTGKLPYGTAHVSVNSLGNKRFGVFLARKIIAWSDKLLERNAGLV